MMAARDIHTSVEEKIGGICMIKARLHQVRAKMRFAHLSTIGALSLGLLLAPPPEVKFNRQTILSMKKLEPTLKVVRHGNRDIEGASGWFATTDPLIPGDQQRRLIEAEIGKTQRSGRWAAC